jgi:hypothetical protein
MTETFFLAITSEEEKRNCCVDGPVIAELLVPIMNTYLRLPKKERNIFNFKNLFIKENFKKELFLNKNIDYLP